MVFPNPLKSAVVSIPFPHDKIIATYKITIFIKGVILIVTPEINLLQFFKKL